MPMPNNWMYPFDKNSHIQQLTEEIFKKALDNAVKSNVVYSYGQLTKEKKDMIFEEAVNKAIDEGVADTVTITKSHVMATKDNKTVINVPRTYLFSANIENELRKKRIAEHRKLAVSGSPVEVTFEDGAKYKGVISSYDGTDDTVMVKFDTPPNSYRASTWVRWDRIKFLPKFKLGQTVKVTDEDNFDDEKAMILALPDSDGDYLVYVYSEGDTFYVVEEEMTAV